ncbi:hypothetical protein KCU64_g462, partial [Aureobasidium melanogenum]
MLVLNELDLPYELIDVDMSQGEHKRLEFVRDIHPFGKLPALEDGSLHVFESRAICRYLVAKYAPSDSALLPLVDPEDLARFEQAASVEYSYFDTSIFKVAYEKIFKQFFSWGGADAAVVKMMEKSLKEVLDYYDKLLASQSYLTSNALPNLAWPQPVQIFQLWQTYIDNVNPMVNLLHTQTVQRMVLQATACKQEELPKQSRALLSSVFLAAIESLSDEDCLNLMVLPKDECVKNLFVMTKECLVDANFMEVATTEVLQALVLYLMAARQHSSPQSLWLVIGVAVRLAHRLGIHREKNLQGMTVFAAEMNRRLWWQIYLLNRHYVNLCEDIDSSDPAHILTFDTNRPLNLNDADLHPEMTTMPPEREGVTEMLFCSIRYEIGSFVRNLSLTVESQSRIEAIHQLEARLEEKYARHCDGSIPLQRVSSASDDLSAGNESQAFDTALLLLQTQHSSCASQMLDRYRWHTKLFYCFEALFPVLHTLAFGETSDPIASDAWQQVSLAYHYNPELLDSKHRSFYSSYCRSLNSLVLRAWSRRASTTDCVPDFVQQVQLQQRRPTGQDNAESWSANMQRSSQSTQHPANEYPSDHHMTLENSEIDGKSWEYWLNIFDNEELLGI